VAPRRIPPWPPPPSLLHGILPGRRRTPERGCGVAPAPQAPPHPEMPAPEVLRTKEEAPPVPEPPARRPLTRWAWQGAGLSLVGLGTLGAVVPGLPTTVFFIGAAACFARSSPRLERWVLGLPHVGPLVRDYRSGLGMPRRAKVAAIAAIAVAVTLSAFALGSWAVRAAVVGLGLVGVGYVGLRVPTRERVLEERARRGAP